MRLFDLSCGFKVVHKNLQTETQELDIILRSSGKNEFLKSLNSPFVLVECKNWKSRVGVSEARVFESKWRESGTRVNLGIFVAINGVTAPFAKHLNSLIRDGVNVAVISKKDIISFLYSEDFDIESWIEEIVTIQFIHKG